MKEKKMAIMKDVGFGLRDCGHIVLFFNAMDGDYGSLQILGSDDYIPLINAYDVYDVHDLEGKPVWIEKDGMMSTYKEPCII